MLRGGLGVLGLCRASASGLSVQNTGLWFRAVGCKVSVFEFRARFWASFRVAPERLTISHA